MLRTGDRARPIAFWCTGQTRWSKHSCQNGRRRLDLRSNRGLEASPPMGYELGVNLVRDLRLIAGPTHELLGEVAGTEYVAIISRQK